MERGIYDVREFRTRIVHFHRESQFEAPPSRYLEGGCVNAVEMNENEKCGVLTHAIVA